MLFGILVGFIIGVALTACYNIDKRTNLTNEVEYLRHKQQDLLNAMASSAELHRTKH